MGFFLFGKINSEKSIPKETKKRIFENK